MLRDIITNKWILIGIGILIICIGLCYLWYQQTTAPYREQVKELDERIRQTEKQQTEITAKDKEQAADASMERETSTTEKSTTDTTIERTVDNNIGLQTLPDVLHIRGLTSSNPFFVDGVPAHLQCPTDLIGKYYHEIPAEAAAEVAAKIQGISLEVMEKYNPNRPISDIWNQFIEAERFYHDNSPVEGRKLTTSQGRADWTVQTYLDFPEIVQIAIDDGEQFYDMCMVELGYFDANWNLHKLPDGREFRTKTGYRYEFTYTKEPDNPLSPVTTRGFSHSNPDTSILIRVNLNETSDEELERMSGWNYNINPFTTENSQ